MERGKGGCLRDMSGVFLVGRPVDELKVRGVRVLVGAGVRRGGG
jgi:hypothetical protein